MFDIAAALEAQIEIPSWLEEIDVGEGAEPALPDFGTASETAASEEPAPTSPETPDWLTEVAEAEELEGAGVSGVEPVAGEAAAVEDATGWLAELGAEPGDEEAPSGPGEEELPDFIPGLAAEAGAEEMAPVPAEPGEQSMDWLNDLRGEVGEEDISGPVPAEIPDWMQELAPAEAGPAAEVPGGEEPPPAAVPDWMRELAPAEAEPTVEVPAEEAGAPGWVEGEGMPSGEEALAWLGQLAAGKEEELQAQVEAEVEARTAEIMGRSSAEGPVAEVPEAPAAEAPVEEEPMAGLFAEEAAAPVAVIKRWVGDHVIGF